MTLLRGERLFAEREFGKLRRLSAIPHKEHDSILPRGGRAGADVGFAPGSYPCEVTLMYRNGTDGPTGAKILGKVLGNDVPALCAVAEAAAALRDAELAQSEHMRTVSPWLDKTMTEVNPAWGIEQGRLRDEVDACRVALDAALMDLGGAA